MTPPLADNGGSTAPQSIYRFPMATSKPLDDATANYEAKSGPIINTQPRMSQAQNTVAPPPTRYICSPLTSEAARYFIHRRLLLPTLAIPACLLVLPTVAMSCMTTLAYLGTSSAQNLPAILILSGVILSSTFSMIHLATTAIRTHAPNKKDMDDALRRSRYALPFWSFIVSLMVVRLFHSFFGALTSLVVASESTTSGWFGWIFGLFSSNLSWSLLTIQSCISPALAWSLLSLTIMLRYISPLSPFMRCSCVPLRINPLDATLGRIGRNCTSRERFLDMIASGVDVLAAPSHVVRKNSDIKPVAMNTNPTSTQPVTMMPQDTSWGSTNFLAPRYSRPIISTILLLAIPHAYAGHLFGHTILLPFLEALGLIDSENAMSASIILRSCIFASVSELLSSVQEAELRFSTQLDAQQIESKIKKLGLITVGAPIISAILSQVFSRGHLFLHGHEVPVLASTMPVMMYSIVLSFLSTGVVVGVMGIQDELTRWSICAPDINPDLLLDKVIVKSQNNEKLFLSEDLYVQSVLMGDGATAEHVLNPTVARSKGPREDEIERNQQACAFFAQWIKNFSAKHSGKISDDILRMCLLQSIGGSSGTQEKTILKRLRLSAAFSAPRAQPIIVPLARSFIAFAGGLGESITECFRQEREDERIVVRKKNSESWVLPSGSLTAGECTILGAARLIATNSTVEERYRTKHLSLLIPCVLQSAYKLRCAMFEYALFEANAVSANLSTPDGTGLLEFIEAKHSELMPVITACDSAAKMVIKCLHKTGNEKVLLQGWKREMHSWIVDLNTQITGA